MAELTAADFPGTDATTGAELARQHNALAGMVTGSTPSSGTWGPAASVPNFEWSSHPVPVAAAAPADSATTTSARAELDQLLADRTAGKLNDAQWQAGPGAKGGRVDQLMATLAGHQPLPTPPRIAADDWRSLYEFNLRPASSAAEYRLPPMGPGAAGAKRDSDVREALLVAQIPAVLGNRLGVEFQRAARALTGTEQQRQALEAEQHVELQQVWGAEYEPRLAAVREFLKDWASRSPLVRSIVTETPLLLTGRAIADLSMLIEHRRGSRQ